MANSITLFISLAVVYIAAPLIRKYTRLFYAGLLLIAAAALTFRDFPLSLLINGGYEALSLWLIVMFVGIKNPFKTMSKKIRLVRTQLSIAAFIFTFSHFLYDFMLTFELSIASGILSMIIMLPLFATSFHFVRKRIKGGSWKRLHRLSYSAYILMLVHVILVTDQATHLIYYSVALFTYLFFKLKASRVSTGLLKYGFLAAILLNLAFSPLINPLMVEEAPQANYASTISSSENIYRDGNYTGIADGYGPDLTVDVTVKDGLISAIDIISHNERGSSFYMPAIESVPGEIIESQSISVDAVSGSSYTSYGIMNAVADALSGAVEAGSIEEIESPEHSEEATGSGRGNGKGLHKGNNQ